MNNFMVAVPDDIQRRIKSISIRGRMAMATTCLENVLSEMQLISPNLAELLNLLWRFVEMNDLGEWDEQITKWRNERGDLSDNSEFKLLPNFILEMIAETDEVGGGNLYGGTVGYSSWTFNPLINVLNLALENGFKVPSIKLFEKSRFSEYDGWGFAVARNFFKS